MYFFSFPPISDAGKLVPFRSSLLTSLSPIPFTVRTEAILHSVKLYEAFATFIIFVAKHTEVLGGDC
jgi:hypothetical protein